MYLAVYNWLRNLENLPRKHFCILIAGGLFLALAVRIFALISLSDSIYFDQMLFDERVYHNWAVQIMNGTWDTKTVYEFAPLPAYFTALLYKLCSQDILVVRIVNIIFGVLTCLFICFVGIELGGRRIGLFSLIIAAVYTPLIFYSIVPLKTAMSLVLFSLFIWLFLKLLNNRSQWYIYLISGIITGLMSSVRPNYLVVIPPFIGFILFLGYRDRVPWKKLAFNTILLGVGMGVATLPFIILKVG